MSDKCPRRGHNPATDHLGMKDELARLQAIVNGLKLAFKVIRGSVLAETQDVKDLCTSTLEQISKAEAAEGEGKKQAMSGKLELDNEENLDIKEVQRDLREAGITGISFAAAGKLLKKIADLTSDYESVLTVMEKLKSDNARLKETVGKLVDAAAVFYEARRAGRETRGAFDDLIAAAAAAKVTP